MVIELRCELMGLREEGEERAKLTSCCPRDAIHIAPLQASDQGSVSEERVG